MPYYFFTGGLGVWDGCGATGGCGVGAVAGGFLKLSSSCPRPAAKAVPAIDIIRTKQICLINLAPIQFDSSCSWHQPRLPNGSRLVLDIPVVLEDKFAVYKLDSVV